MHGTYGGGKGFGITSGDVAAEYGSHVHAFGDAARARASAAAGAPRVSKGAKKREEDEAAYTTIMLRNIPNKYTQHMLIDQLHREGFRGDIDYLYLPIDFANRCNCGYCFVNFRTAAARERFGQAFDGVAVQSCLPGFNSYKVCQVTRAKWQGREENVRRLRSGPELMAQLAAHPEWLPLLLDDRGNQEHFPLDSPSHQPLPQTSRHPGRKGSAGVGPMLAGGPPQPWHFSPADMAEVYGAAAKGGKGPGRGGLGRSRRGTGRGHPGGASALAEYFRGMPGMPVMTEYGLQYLPYGCGPYAAGGYGMPPPYVGFPGGWPPDDFGFGEYDGWPDDGGYFPHMPRGGSPRRVDHGYLDGDEIS